MIGDPYLSGSVAPDALERHRAIMVSVDYSPLDVERAAESLNVSLSEEETDAILARIDVELDALGAAATRSALASKIYDDLSRIAHLHASSDDD